jgi:hypothetical protein
MKHWSRVSLPYIALAMLMACDCSQAGAMPYLAAIGPVPLRFESVVPAKVFSWEPSSPITIQAPPPPVVFKYLAPKPVVEVTTNQALSVAIPADTSTNSVPPPHSANDLLVVTPEMLVDYFKPGGNATNQPDSRVLAPVGFTPPPSVTSPSSQAIYISK